MSWDDDRVAKLVKLHAEGLSCSQIATALGHGITRNAVIGKVSRLNLPKRDGERAKLINRRTRKSQGSVWGMSMKQAAKLKERAAKAPAPPPEAYVEPITNETPTRTFATLERGECRWPIGDPKSEAFGYCGCKAVPGQSYCTGHRLRAYTPAPTLKRAPLTNPDTVPAEVMRQREGVS
jgi:GcrA cell cycle regulator